VQVTLAATQQVHHHQQLVTVSHSARLLATPEQVLLQQAEQAMLVELKLVKMAEQRPMTGQWHSTSAYPHPP